MKALVISGGGSKGAFAGGIAEYLMNTQGNNYDMFVGSSVGSLLISQLALKNVLLLKSIFTNITNKDIFSIDPFLIKKEEGKFNVKINHFNTVRAFLKGCNTFGESKSLKKLIRKVHSKEVFGKVKKGPKVFFTVSNLTQQKVEYIYANNCCYEDFIDWMWASANAVPFMSLLRKNNCQYADGGFGSHVPILCAIENGACEIDVIILDGQQHKTLQNFSNPFQSLMGIFKFMSNQIVLKDVLIGKLKGRQSKIDVKLWFPPENLTNNPLYFNPVLMKEWWEKGYNYAENNKPICHCFLPNGEVKEMNI